MPHRHMVNNEPFWTVTSQVPGFLPLSRDTEADVCVVGAGIAGLTTAYLLMREGKSVVVLEDGEVGDGQTSATTGHLSNALDDRYFYLESRHGQQGARLAAESHTQAIDEIESIVLREKISCDFQRVDGYLFAPPGESASVLEKELDAALRAGLRKVRWAPTAPISTFDTGPCLVFPKQGQFHSLKYLAGLAEAFVRGGGRIFTETRVSEVKGGKRAFVKAQPGRGVVCSHAVVATNVPINDRVAIHTKQAAYRTYVIGAFLPKETIARALYWDTGDPYHYMRLQSIDKEGSDLVIIGGEDHKTGQDENPEGRYEALEFWARKRLPAMGQVLFQWSGQIIEPVDGLAFIGKNPGHEPNVYVITGDSGNGLTHGTLGGMIINDLIMGRENPWAKLYDPSRLGLKSAGEFAHENLNTAIQYMDWVKPAKKSVQEMPCGSGVVVRDGLNPVAVYRDESGQSHEMSAVCPHLGGIVHWNAAESSWDCPCHGSRFDKYGNVLNGPANTGLKPLEAPAKK